MPQALSLSVSPQTVRPLRRRRALVCSAAMLWGLSGSVPLMAQESFPSRPIRFVVPYAAGGTTDLVARTVGARMAQTLGQPVIIDNRAGAGGNIGMDAVAKAVPDGYTVGMGAISTNALNPHIYKKMAFDPRKDFT
ncbi:MAG: tripartite tricarboxylate transporter substrate binding protein, partial [Curvibacter sp.]